MEDAQTNVSEAKVEFSGFSNNKYNVVSGAFISIVVGVVPLCLCTAGTVDSHFILLISDDVGVKRVFRNSLTSYIVP